jgi:hypothetical protein
MAVELKQGRKLEAGIPKTLFQVHVSNPIGVLDRNHYAVTADGQRFLVNTLARQASPPVTVVLNWTPSATFE